MYALLTTQEIIGKVNLILDVSMLWRDLIVKTKCWLCMGELSIFSVPGACNC